MADLVRLSVIQGFSELMREFSVDSEQLIQEANIERTVVAGEDNWVPLESVLQLMELGAAKTQCEHLGLLLASMQKPTAVGLLGLLLESSPNLEWALSKALRHLPIYSQSVVLQTSTEGEFSTLKAISHSPDRCNTRLLTELVMGQTYSVLRAATARRWKPTQVHFHHENPKEDFFYKKYFGVPVVFDSEFDGFCFSSSDLRLPMKSSDERIYAALSQYALSLDEVGNQGVAAQVKRVIRTRLPQGNCNIEMIAKLMACDKRTLQRNLNEAGSSYQSLLDEVRFTLAQEYLKDSTMQLRNLAAMLGYSEFSSFSRAFRKQFGKTPSEWRKQEKNSSTA